MIWLLNGERMDLKKLNEEDPVGYRHYIKIYENKGHWMDNLEASALDWMSDFIRNPYPSKVVWKQGNVLHKRFYWLRNEDPSFGDLIECSINGSNNYHIKFIVIKNNYTIK